MSDSTVDTNIPVTRIPFGANLPPKVPYADADDVGTDTKPLKLVNKKLTPVSGELAPKQAPSFTRTSTGGTTESDVPTSPTPGSADPDSMVATKGYVDSNLGTHGGDLKHVYTKDGVVKDSNGNLNSSGKKLVKMTNGTWSESAETVGANDKPVFLSSGTVTQSDKTLGADKKPIYLSGGQFQESQELLPKVAPVATTASGYNSNPSGPTVNAGKVPTSVTPHPSDPDTMIATKEYVDSSAIVFKWTSGSSYVVIYGNGWCNFGGYVDNRRVTDTPGRYYYNGMNWGTGVAKHIRPYIPVSAVYGAQVTDNGGAIAPTGVSDYRTIHQSYTIGSFNINKTTSSEALVSIISVYFNANQWTLSNIYRGYKLACNAVVHDSFLTWLKSNTANVETLKTYLNSTVRTATSVGYICIPATESNRSGTSSRANTSDTYNESKTLSDDKCGFAIDSTSEGGGEDIPSDPGEDIVIGSSGKILVVTPGGAYANTNIAGVGSCTRSGSGPYTFTIKPFRSGYLSVDFCCENVDGSVNLSLSVDGTILAYSHGYPSNKDGITICIPVKANMTVVIAGSPVATPYHANVYII